MPELLRTITVSIPVYASIWADRQEGENSEDEILRRKFKLAKATEPPPSQRDFVVTVGYHDPKFGVTIEPGFTIYRRYKGVDYSAQAIQGFWVLSTTGKGYPTLHQLNQAVRQGHENAWNVWWYKDAKGAKHPVSDLREASKVQRRA